MQKIQKWDKLPTAVRRHLIERMRDRSISIENLNAPDIPNFIFNSQSKRLYYIDMKPSNIVRPWTNEQNLRNIREIFS